MKVGMYNMTSYINYMQGIKNVIFLTIALQEFFKKTTKCVKVKDQDDSMT